MTASCLQQRTPVLSRTKRDELVTLDERTDNPPAQLLLANRGLRKSIVSAVLIYCSMSTRFLMLTCILAPFVRLNQRSYHGSRVRPRTASVPNQPPSQSGRFRVQHDRV
ncbi:hypothetical protein BN2476_160029 [Paraburkholderia piptadeniae]|uniref:Uncharacterized protein n=1 Tax=Paraburkholderia piptadeniae TaxID=1701573 RepID=A0A1N7RSL4_9BURK|nr:hypothetical protein BN2476_160029 [Paraburkholderia piptadeniae]